MGHFGDASIPLADRILAAQTFVLVGALLTLVLAALFSEKRQNESALKKSNAKLKDSNERLRLALDKRRSGCEYRPAAHNNPQQEREHYGHGYSCSPIAFWQGNDEN